MWEYELHSLMQHVWKTGLEGARDELWNINAAIISVCSAILRNELSDITPAPRNVSLGQVISLIQVY